MEIETLTRLEDDGVTEYQVEEWLPVQHIKEIELSASNNKPIEKNQLPGYTKSINLITHTQPENIPSSVRNLKIREFDEDLTQEKIPSNISSLHLGEYYDKPITASMIPPNITHLNLGWRFSADLSEEMLPATVKSLVLGETFNTPFKKNSIPNSLKILEVGANFSEFQSLIHLPESIETFIFGDNFNRSLESNFKLPKTIKTLIFGKQFNHPIPNGILENEDGLETLKLGSSFAQPLTIDNVPSSVKHLEAPNRAQQYVSEEIFNKYYSLKACLDNKDPSKKGHLEIGDAHKKYLFDKGLKLVIPPSINSLTLHNDAFLKKHNIPRSIKYLTFGSDFINTDNLTQEIDGANIQEPQAAANAISNFDKRFFIRARDIPKTTTHISINSPHIVLDFIPSHITHFKTSKNYFQQINILKNNNNLKSLKIKLLNLNYIIHDELRPLQK
ncbi:hypothetical protein DICPUDRAFT_31953 [Dictyostelium purpureum]|uniref:FNIP repeat-containing protein n=1 Tax=Dictyostelium purpureum TaxID=5786 RepID=F0ZI43_DICPU|nr:uncharacterized protein DICPUDRAFT_31953 [Dictyostelium purpureum]EGC36382.1 hypothetical protein DICPUDRAFT_31953 [Dictyostelium purpureum]|eukprot:XP_003287079.1 hypothetical protein DICPUDRAFT_31953 [Dictyostelium purpureum]